MAQEDKKKTKESTARKSPWRYLFAACAVYGAIKLLPGLWVNLIYLGVQIRDRFSPQSMAVSIGVIGGADGPTAVFVTGPVWMSYVIPVTLLIVGIWGFIRFSRCREKE